ncbi:NAD(P)-binding protein [Heliocybe sulcata]|uniref:NAD(P)-binding protein n=1 Tax=Heliocybe sulcata TaxID=5364 RepID=A0A5C3MNJ2_9AGAM|nr:NAD(P)-binding protein [Heliocybe sulcata]
MVFYVVTGASRGIGLEFVNQLSSNPENQVFALVRNKNTATKLADINRPNVHVLQADITDSKALLDAAAEVARVTGGKLDVLINNAALVPAGRAQGGIRGYPPEAQDELARDLRESFEVNVVGVVLTTNAFLPLIQKGTAKKVITISSGLADLDSTLEVEVTATAPYAITKAATNMTVAKYAVDYKKDGIAFLALTPGVVDTSSTAPPGAEQPSPEDMQQTMELAGRFQKKYPHWKGPMTPQESVRHMMEVIDNLTVEKSGQFISHLGSKQWL